MSDEPIVIYCPDENIRLSVERLTRQATGGGKAAILRLAWEWAEMGHSVTVACALAEEGRVGRLAVTSTPPQTQGDEVAIFVTGARGHFEGWEEPGKKAWRKVFWINGPNQVHPPQLDLHWVIAPSQFLALRATAEWGFAPEKVVTIRGEAANPVIPAPGFGGRDPHRGVFASHPAKGLDFAIAAFQQVRRSFPNLQLDIYGSERLWGDSKRVLSRSLPAGVTFCGERPSTEMSHLMARYGFMLYLSPVIDGFSSATAEAMAAGVVVFATAHGSNAELIRHGWNGFLIPLQAQIPNLDIAERLLGRYASDPTAFEPIRERAVQSIPTWRDQAEQWRQVWRSTPL